MSPMKWPAVAVAVVLALGIAAVLPGALEAKKPEPPPEGPRLVALERVSLQSGSCTSFVGVDTSGRVLVSQCYTGAMAVAAQLPSEPVSLHYVGGGLPELYIGLANGDIYRQDDTRAALPWNLRYMGNLFTASTSRFPDLPPQELAPSSVESSVEPETVRPGMVR